MLSWFTSLALIYYLSFTSVDAYRLLNYGQYNRPLVPHPPLIQHPQTICYLNSNLPECSYLPMNVVLKMLIDEQTRQIQYQNERMLERLYENAYNHNRQSHIQRVTQPLMPVYPQFTTYNRPLSWPLRRSPLNTETFRNPSIPMATVAASTANANGLYTNILSNRKIITNKPSTDISRWVTAASPATFSTRDKITPVKVVEITHELTNVEPTNNNALLESPAIDETADNNATLPGSPATNETVDTNILSALHNNSTETIVPVSNGPVANLVETTWLPRNVTPLIFNVHIGVNTKSDDKFTKKYITINAFTQIPKQSNITLTTFTTNSINGVVADNETYSTESSGTEFRITQTNKINNWFTASVPQETEAQRRQRLLVLYTVALDKLERKFYAITFNKLTSISPEGRQENGISFVQSGLFLSLHLMAFSTETDKETKAEIDACLGLNITDADKLNITQELISDLPKTSFDLKWRWSSRLVLGANQNVSDEFRYGAASALNLRLGKFYGNETDEMLASILNHMIVEDSGGAIRNTFDPEELSGGVRAVALTTLYLRARWRSAPTVLNGTRRFLDAEGAPPRTVRMIRINDYMRYANFEDWGFQAIEIFYATRGLSLLVLVPHGRSLRSLAELLETVSVAEIGRRMITMRVAVTMPLYTLRMTLLMPSKLKALGVNKLISDNNATDSGRLKLSHAVQRLMFWAEAGRNAFKDDGIEWDPEPELELVVDRPYLFFVRWHNITLMNGNFVL